MWVEGANPSTPKPPPSYSWGRFSAHISQIKQKVLKGYSISLFFRFEEINNFKKLICKILPFVNVAILYKKIFKFFLTHWNHKKILLTESNTLIERIAIYNLRRFMLRLLDSGVNIIGFDIICLTSYKYSLVYQTKFILSKIFHYF